jgi:hypothetical protein
MIPSIRGMSFSNVSQEMMLTDSSRGRARGYSHAAVLVVRCSVQVGEQGHAQARDESAPALWPAQLPTDAPRKCLAIRSWFTSDVITLIPSRPREAAT